MSADLIAAWLVTDADKTLNWGAVPAAIHDLSLADIEAGLNEATGGDWGAESQAILDNPEPRSSESRQAAYEEASLREGRKEVEGIFDALKDAIDGDSRQTLTMNVRGATVYLAGGVSYGDDPSEDFRAICDAQWFPSVLRAIGFDITD